MDVTRQIQIAVVRADMFIMAAWHILIIAMPVMAVAVISFMAMRRLRRRR